MACQDSQCAPSRPPDARFRRVLWVALVLNTLMFAIELTGGISADAKSLLADAADFLGDAANYAISLLVLPLGLGWRARAALVKGVSMGLYGLGVLIMVGLGLSRGEAPDALTMGVIGALALVVNVVVALLLYAFREGDANMRSVWLCSRNDAIGNLAVLAAASGVFLADSGWPDLLVASGMALLALTSAWQVIRQASRELAAGGGA